MLLKRRLNESQFLASEIHRRSPCRYLGYARVGVSESVAGECA